MKRIITRVIPEQMSMGAVMYDGMIDMIVPDETDHTDALYVANDTPVMGKDEDENTIKVADVTELVAADKSIIARQTFAGWPIVGKPAPE